MTDLTPAQAATPEPQAGDGQQTVLEQSSGQTATEWTPDAAAAAIREARKEAENYRRKLREAEKAQAEAAAKAAEEQGQYKPLYESLKERVAQLEPLEERVRTLTEATTAANEKRVKALPEAMRGLVPDYDDPFKLAAWLDANAAVLVKPVAPSLDGRAAGSGTPTVTDAEVLDFAQRMGVKPEHVDRSVLAKAIRR